MISEHHESIRQGSSTEHQQQQQQQQQRNLVDSSRARFCVVFVVSPVSPKTNRNHNHNHKVWERSVWNDDTEEWKLPNLKPKKEFSNFKLPPMGGDDGGGGGGGKELTAEEVEKKRRRRERKEKEREKVRFFPSCLWFVSGFVIVFSCLDSCSFSWLEVTHTPPARVV